MKVVSVYVALCVAALSTTTGASSPHRFLAKDDAVPAVCEYKDFKDVLTCVKDNNCVDQPRDQIAGCVTSNCMQAITEVLSTKNSCMSVFMCLQGKMGNTEVTHAELEECAPAICSWSHLRPLRKCAHIQGKCLGKPADTYQSCMATNCAQPLAALMEEQPQCQVKTACLAEKISALGSDSLEVGKYYGSLYTCADHRVEFDDVAEEEPTEDVEEEDVSEDEEEDVSEDEEEASEDDEEDVSEDDEEGEESFEDDAGKSPESSQASEEASEAEEEEVFEDDDDEVFEDEDEEEVSEEDEEEEVSEDDEVSTTATTTEDEEEVSEEPLILDSAESATGN